MFESSCFYLFLFLCAWYGVVWYGFRSFNSFRQYFSFFFFSFLSL